MAHDLTEDTTTFPAVTVPDGPDPRTAASVLLPFTQLMKRSAYNKATLDTKGAANGLAPLNGTSKVPTANITKAILDIGGAFPSQTWNALITTVSSGLYQPTALGYTIPVAVATGDIVLVDAHGLLAVDGANVGAFQLSYTTNGGGSWTDVVDAYFEAGALAAFAFATRIVVAAPAAAFGLNLRLKKASGAGTNVYLNGTAALRVMAVRP